MMNTTAGKDSIRNLSLKQVRASMMQFQAQQQTFSNAYRIGQLYNYMVDTNLAQQANYRGALDYFSQNFPAVPRSTLSIYSTVARHFSEQVCTRFGTTTLSLLLTYEVVTGIQANHEAPGGTLIQVPGTNGAVKYKPFSECSVQEMRKALKRLRKPGSGRSIPTAPLSHVDRGQPVKARSLEGKSARRPSSTDLGEVVIHFKNIPQSQVEKLSEALMGQFQSLRVKARVA